MPDFAELAQELATDARVTDNAAEKIEAELAEAYMDGRREAGPTADQLLAQLRGQVADLQRQLDDAHRREQAAHGAAAVLQNQRAMTRAYLGDLLADHLGVTPLPETRVGRPAAKDGPPSTAGADQ